MKISIDPGLTETAIVPWIGSLPQKHGVVVIRPKGNTTEDRLYALWSELEMAVRQLPALWWNSKLDEKLVERRLIDSAIYDIAGVKPPGDGPTCCAIEDNGAGAKRQQYATVATGGRAIQVIKCVMYRYNIPIITVQTDRHCKEKAAQIAHSLGWPTDKKKYEHINDALYIGYLAGFDRL